MNPHYHKHGSHGSNFDKKFVLNDQIRAKEVRLIDDEGKQVGVVTVEEAKRMAQEKSLDLLLVSTDADPPVCKIIDYDQYRYQQKKKDKKSKKSGRIQVIKELKMSPKISSNDYNVRVAKAKEFLTKKHKVKVVVFFKGREITHPELGKTLMAKFVEDVKDLGTVESDVSAHEKTLCVVLNPK